jgi:Domain of unknown function (DUF4386)
MRARLTGLLWLTCIVTGLVAYALAFPLISRGDAATTATNILANPLRFRIAFALDLTSSASYLGVTALLYHLLRPAGRSLSFTAAFFGLGGVAISGISYTGQLAALSLLRGAGFSAFTTSQLQALALVAVQLRFQVFVIVMAFFGIQCLLAGIAIARSGLMPRALGALLALGGASYVIVSFVDFLAPEIGARLAPFVMPIALIGEGAITAWLLAKGVRQTEPLDV